MPGAVRLGQVYHHFDNNIFHHVYYKHILRQGTLLKHFEDYFV